MKGQKEQKQVSLSTQDLERKPSVPDLNPSNNVPEEKESQSDTYSFNSRVQLALRSSTPVQPNLGFSVTCCPIQVMSRGSLHCLLPHPRSLI